MTRAATIDSLHLVDQTTFGNPGGNCFSACLATILGMPLEHIPYVMGAEDWFDELQRWLATVGMYACLIVARPVTAPAGLNIVSGHSPRYPDDASKLHSVVAWGADIIHDPHPSRAGLLSTTDHLLLVPIDPRRWSAR